jgi:hypothetical protein
MRFFINSENLDWNMSSRMCEIMTSYLSISKELTYIFDSLLEMDETTFMSSKKTILQMNQMIHWQYRME